MKQQLAFGLAVRERRDALSLTQLQIGARAGMQSQYIGRVERGEINVSYSTLQKIAEALEWPAWRLVLAADEAAAGDTKAS